MVWWQSSDAVCVFGGMMAKKDKSSTAEDYLAQAKWESSHPLDRRDRPSTKHQSQLRNQDIYSKSYKKFLFFRIIKLIMITLSFVLLFICGNDYYPGIGILGITTVLSTGILFYFLNHPSKKS
jgi:hypothetical protein